MNLPNVPTDNLYKFLAIFGLVIIVVTNTLFFMEGNNLISQGTVFLQSATISTYDQKAITEDRDNAQKVLDNLNKALQTIPLQQQQAYLNQIAKEQDIIRNDNNKLVEINNNILRFNDGKELINWMNFEGTALALFVGIGNAIGIVVVWYGFRLWYTRLQKYQDKMIKHKAEA